MPCLGHNLILLGESYIIKLSYYISYINNQNIAPETQPIKLFSCYWCGCERFSSKYSTQSCISHWFCGKSIVGDCEGGKLVAWSLGRPIYGRSPWKELKGGAKLDEHIADTAPDIVLLLEGCYQPQRSGPKIASAFSWSWGQIGCSGEKLSFRWVPRDGGCSLPKPKSKVQSPGTLCWHWPIQLLESPIPAAVTRDKYCGCR